MTADEGEPDFEEATIPEQVLLKDLITRSSPSKLCDRRRLPASGVGAESIGDGLKDRR